MIHEAPTEIRQLKTLTHEADLIVVGGGIAGTCAAIAAAREGLQVVLVQDRQCLERGEAVGIGSNLPHG